MVDRIIATIILGEFATPMDKDKRGYLRNGEDLPSWWPQLFRKNWNVARCKENEMNRPTIAALPISNSSIVDNMRFIILSKSTLTEIFFESFKVYKKKKFSNTFF